MDAKEKQLFTVMWKLVRDYHALLGEFLPVVGEIAVTLADTPPPSPDQLRKWKERYDEMQQKYEQTLGAFEAVRQIADPAFGYDA